MAYTAKTWVTGEVIQAVDLNHAEQGIATAQSGVDAISANGAIGTANLANASVTNAKLDQGAVDTSNIANGAVGTTEIQDGAVTTPKIAGGAVTTAKISDGAVTDAKLAQSGGVLSEVADLKSAITQLDDIVVGDPVADFSVILSNNNAAVTNNNDGTYSIGTNDYGTTVFAQKLTLSAGKYEINGTANGYMALSTTTNPNDAVVVSYSEPIEFEITETLECYFMFRMDSKASAAFVITPYIKKIGIKNQSNDLAKLILSAMNGAEDVSNLYVDSVIIVDNVADGTTIDITPVLNTSVKTAIIPCKSGDIFTVSGHGVQTGLLWTFTDNNYKKLSGSPKSFTSDVATVTAPQDGYFISVVNKSYSYTLSVKRFTTPKTHQVVNPHELKWVMGQFGNTGVVGGTFNDRMYTILKVKAGSIIAAPSEYGVNVKFGYYLGEPTGTMDYYQNFGYGFYKITQDCTLFLGVVYNTPAYLLNDSLLDSIRVSLIVEDFEAKYAKKSLGNYGVPISPSIYYEGQHTDTTGWTNETVDVDAIHTAFDALVTASNGYLTKKDLGEVWNGYHYYEYSTNPVGIHVTGLKVPKVLVTCEMHGNEKMSTYAMHYMLYDLIHNPQKNPVLSYIRSNVQLVIIPITNPWGFINTNRWNENGVNLNRNFPTYAWADYDEGEDSAIGGINYKGASAGSEPETKAMMNFIRSHPDAVLCIDLHTNGTNTSAWYEVTSTMLACTDNTQDPSYEMQRKYYEASKIQINYVKPWCDAEYGSDLGNVYYGNVIVWNDEPYISEWVTESTNVLGITYEVPAGSSDGYLGTKLTKYSPDTIKCSAELFGNYILSMLCVAKDN